MHANQPINFKSIEHVHTHKNTQTDTHLLDGAAIELGKGQRVEVPESHRVRGAHHLEQVLQLLLFAGGVLREGRLGEERGGKGRGTA
jgi:hypothetical protein